MRTFMFTYTHAYTYIHTYIDLHTGTKPFIREVWDQRWDKFLDFPDFRRQTRYGTYGTEIYQINCEK